MKLSLTAIALSLAAPSAFAGVLSCSFTEPFFSVEFDSKTGKVVEVGVEDYNDKTGKFEPRVLTNKGKLVMVDNSYNAQKAELRDEKGNVLLTVKFTGQGSDGMSDLIFPMDGERNGFVGGCDTKKYPAFRSEDLFSDLGIKTQ